MKAQLHASGVTPCVRGNSTDTWQYCNIESKPIRSQLLPAIAQPCLWVARYRIPALRAVSSPPVLSAEHKRISRSLSNARMSIYRSAVCVFMLQYDMPKKAKSKHVGQKPEQQKDNRTHP